MSTLVSTGLIESVVRYCWLCMVVFYNLVTFAMQENIKQEYTIKFCVKLTNFARETFSSLNEAYGDATVSRTVVFKWHKPIKLGLIKCWRRPSFWKTNLVNKWLKCENGANCDGERRPIGCQDVAEEMGLDKNAVHRIVTDDLYKRIIRAKLAPNNLAVE